ncbi:related to nif-specific regulatory protein [Rhynchosporium agropyri]|uniref:Related to nif-specific regulatory protein n=1 Tax=Rhynchosporium agropyri TaxID=914238 RepID=A0A1E1LFM5_9HELO|nr:related to nif-specific regulatory protein [Rhynchosporium agropyri]
MAMSPSPQLSPTMGPSHRNERDQSNTPPLQPQQLSKRDKKRTVLADRLQDITMAFSANRDQHYRAQLQSIQVDSNLIGEADVHSRQPLPDSAEEVEKLVNINIQKTMMKNILPEPPLKAGKIYADFAKEVNDAMEERDSAMVVLKRDYDVKMNEINSYHAYKKLLSKNEYKSLSDTLRDRLINSVMSKKARLSKDKDAIEIGEGSTHALLLHPSQFGITNPASPGGILGKRATRHRRDVEEVSNVTENHKGKRKAHDSDDSPAPRRQRLDNGASTPSWSAEKQQLMAHQVESSLYSVDKLFNEKELTMAYNTAALAAHSYMLRHPPFSDDPHNQTNGKSDSSSDHDKVPTSGEADAEDADSPSTGAAMMERQFSHATRSTRGAAVVSGYGIDMFNDNDMNYPPNLLSLTRQIPRLPQMIFQQNSRQFASNPSKDAIATLQGLSAEDANADIEVMRRARTHNDEKGYGSNLDLEQGARSLLEEAAFPKKYQHWVKSDNKDKLTGHAIATSSLREDYGGQPMMKQISQGASSMGGTPMSRQATDDSITRSGKRAVRRG